jgi:RHS repeat-associated protein
MPLLVSVADAGAGTQKVWTFGTTGLAATYEEIDPSHIALLHKDYTWTQDHGHPYIGTVVTTLNPGQAYSAATKTVQQLDAYGNLTQSDAYAYNSLTTPARTYKFEYGSGNYSAYHIYNRQSKATVTVGTTTTTLATNTYDEPTMPPQLNPTTLHDDVNYGYNLGMVPPLTFLSRGNLTTQVTPKGTSHFTYASTGVRLSSTDETGVTVSTATDSTTNYSLPTVITPGGDANLATTLSYNSSWAVTSVTGANGANATTTYDVYGRPATSKVPDGAITTYTYTYLPNTQTATLGTRWTKTTLDGFGRAMKVETGHDSTTVSVAETEYAPCACSPLGKLYRTARPHAPGDPKQWTTYTYDASGRTLTVKLPDNSTTQYAYTGNTTMVTDPAGKWKKQTTDAFGNLTTVTEPNPAGGADWTTSYTYDILGNLTRVEMPRPYNGGTYTQVRTFTYNGTRLATETNPETGTITYGYDGNGRLSTKTNARGQQSTYTYDSLGRVTHHGGVKESIDYHYDSNPVDPAFTQNGWGRVTAVEITGPAGLYGANVNLKYLYSYTQTGHVNAQRMTAATSRSGDNTVAMDASYGWDNEGRMTSLTGPGGTDTYAFDVMGRLSSGGATYGPAGELLTFNGVNRIYNNLGQLTRMTKSGVMDMEYRYDTTTHNNGRIAQSKDYVTGEEVTYSYDSLNRLSHAETTDSAWGTTYVYDGWGNLLQKNGTKGSPPPLNISYDPSLNMPVGSTPPSGLTGVDEEDRTITGLGELGGYGDFTFDQSGKKISVMWMGQDGQLHCELYFHSITGQRLARYQCGTFEGTDANGNPSTGFSVWFHDAAKHIGGQLTTWNNTGATTDRLGSIRAMDNGERYSYYPYGESHTATGGNAQYAGLESPVRAYDPNAARFNRPDPLGMKGVVMGDPGSWNRFAYAGGDPVNFRDHRGLWIEPTAVDCTNDPSLPGCHGPCSPLARGFMDMDDPECNDDDPGPGPPPPPAPSAQTCGDVAGWLYGALTSDEVAGVSVILGENSWGFIGANQYSDGDRAKHGTGSVLTQGDVFLEDRYIADVLLNRADTNGMSIASVAGQSGQFAGYATGKARYGAYSAGPAGTSECDDLITAIGAFKLEEEGPRVDTSVMFFVATVQGGRARRRRPGDIRIADTDFSSNPFVPGRRRRR